MIWVIPYVVEHDEDAIRQADHVIDIGVGAGVHGGYVIAQGTVDDIMASEESLTGQYMSGKKSIKIPKVRHKPKMIEVEVTGKAKPKKVPMAIELKGATGNNLQNVDLTLPIGIMTCITGVSGSGKSTLINRTLMPLAATQLNNAC